MYLCDGVAMSRVRPQPDQLSGTASLMALRHQIGPIMCPLFPGRPALLQPGLP
ncbi:hypothetical protein CBM2586_B130558 [Cupriavidus phytorum]|uniref:Uncharacterized protein n=1 Tax=Cupriavidus taiwanensis TaxID=164546 RepID=A0A976AA73_9BURK|nr:hypothetical protein CBM2586_B130558 [Cupriavidus taiwanensis]